MAMVRISCSDGGRLLAESKLFRISTRVVLDATDGTSTDREDASACPCSWVCVGVESEDVGGVGVCGGACKSEGLRDRVGV